MKSTIQRARSGEGDGFFSLIVQQPLMIIGDNFLNGFLIRITVGGKWALLKEYWSRHV